MIRSSYNHALQTMQRHTHYHAPQLFTTSLHTEADRSQAAAAGHRSHQSAPRLAGTDGEHRVYTDNCGSLPTEQFEAAAG